MQKNIKDERNDNKKPGVKCDIDSYILLTLYLGIYRVFWKMFTTRFYSLYTNTIWNSQIATHYIQTETNDC